VKYINYRSTRSPSFAVTLMPMKKPRDVRFFYPSKQRFQIRLKTNTKEVLEEIALLE
jgi:hypothetical protein